MMDTIDSPVALVARLVGVVTAYRGDARARPVCYELAMSSHLEIQPAEDVRVQLVLLPLQGLFAQPVGDADSLAGLRGWVGLEINQQLHRGADLGAHFERVWRVGSANHVSGCLASQIDCGNNHPVL